MSAVSTIQQRVTVEQQPTRAATVARHAVIGGAIGAAAGAALSFTALPIVGVLSAPLAAAIGGAAGIVVGGIVGIFRSRSSAEQSQVGAAQVAPPAPGTGSGPSPQLPPPLPS
jgi:hypothetical protein